MHRIFLWTTVFLVCILGITVAAPTAEAAFGDRAKDMAKITGIRIGRMDGNVRIVVDSDRPISYRQRVLANPTRVVVDVQNAWIVPAYKKNITVDSSLVSGVRAAQFDASTVRIVVETSVGKDGYKVFALSGGKPRIVMDFGAAPGGSAGTKKPPESVQPRGTDGGENNSNDRDISAITGMKGRKIAIDPGHGGSDSGAIGPTGIMETSVTSAVSSSVCSRRRAQR